MGWFKRLLGFQEKETIPGEVVTPAETTPIVERIVWKKCECCKESIYEGDKYSKQMGGYYHRKCWKSLVRETWNH